MLFCGCDAKIGSQKCSSSLEENRVKMITFENKKVMKTALLGVS
jgi:hypothetical protein